MPLAAAGVALALTSCSPAGGTPPAADRGSASTTTTTAPAAQATLAIAPVTAAEPVRLDAPIQVTVLGGRLRDVVAVGTDGSRVQGQASADGTSWTSTTALRAGLTYQVRATAADPAGLTTQRVSRFTTIVPAQTDDASILPRDGWTVGVGMPVVVQFDTPVENRAAAERALQVQTSSALEGAWRWESDQQVQWRPRDYWPTGESVSVTADLAAVEVAPGVWGTDSGTASFTVGSSMVSTVDVLAHTMTVRRDGQVLRTIPVTTGKAGFDTRNGVKVIMTRESRHQMDAATTGVAQDSPEYYDLVVDHAMRLTWSGEFVHAAPWSVAQQGRANVSHGCTGMSDADAAWIFEQSKVGDVVEFVGSDRSLEWGNGYTAWNMDFATWAQGSAR